ncbi:MAG TPA: hypothetical protein VFP76_00130 [Gemmatimonadota bacterium]|nr:hypothetical protein [Gemmatimonadota bacterium]
MRKALYVTCAWGAGAAVGLLGCPPVAAQSLRYGPEQGASFRYRTDNELQVSQRILGRENLYVLKSGGVVRLTLLHPGNRLLWRLGFDELSMRVEGAFPSPRVEELRGTVVNLTTNSRGVVLEAVASGVVPPGLGARYVERAATAFLPHLPSAERPVSSWTDTLTVTEVLQGVTTEIETVVNYTVSDTSALAGRAVVPVEYEGSIVVRGSGTLGGSNVSLSGRGTVSGHYLYDPGERIFDLHEQEQVLDSTLTLDSPEGMPVAIPSRQVLRAHSERLF